MNNISKNIGKISCVLTVFLLFSSLLFTSYSAFTENEFENSTKKKSSYFSELLPDELVFEKELFEEEEEFDDENSSSWNNYLFASTNFSLFKAYKVELPENFALKQENKSKKLAKWLEIRHLII
jgi:Na+-translocating ferredoxin:NAD+ oxidoreductase RnfG subunit